MPSPYPAQGRILRQKISKRIMVITFYFTVEIITNNIILQTKWLVYILTKALFYLCNV